MREFTTADVPVYLVDKDGGFVVRSMAEVSLLHIYRVDELTRQLLPDSFGPDDLH